MFISDRYRILLLMAILAVVGLAIGGATLIILYNTSFDQTRERLIEAVQSRARLIEAMARHTRRHLEEHHDAAGVSMASPERILAEILDQLREAHEHFPGMGRTGEFTLGQRQGDEIVFLLHRRHDNTGDTPIPVPHNSLVAEPMRRALSGNSGWVVGMDYRGVEVLAAHEPVRLLGMGIVAKLDMAEVRHPYEVAAGLAFFAGLGVILIGVLFFFRVGEPLLRQIHEAALLRESRRHLEEARAALQEKAVYLDNILRTATDMAIVATDRDFLILYCNPAAEVMHGLSASEVIGRHLEEIHKQRDVDPERFALGIEHVRIDGEHTYEVRSSQGGRERIIHSRVSGILDDAGGLVGYLLMARDVSDERAVIHSLEKSERRYRLLVESANDAILVADADTGVIVDANPMAEALLGRPLADILGKHQTDLHPIEEMEHYARLFADHVEGRRKTVDNVEVLRADGQRVPVEIRAAVTDLGDQRVILGIFRDVTERRRSEETLRLSRESLVKAQMIAHLGNWDWDVRTNELEWSDEVYHIFGLPPKTCLASFDDYLHAVHPLDRSLVEESIRRTLAEPYPPYDIEHRILRPDGGEVYVHERGALILDVENRPVRMLGTVQDITQRKLMALRMQTLNQELELRVTLRTRDLERSNRDLQQFAYVASHDLQEPLRLVAGFVQLLEKRYAGALDEKATQYIAYVVDGVKHMDALINSLLAYARVETQGEALTLVSCDSVLDRALRYLSRICVASEAVITRDPLPQLTADEGQLIQVFQNLIGNALKFRGEVAPRIHVGCRREGAEWLFTVRDNGIGIDAQYAERIFVIFQKLHARSRYEGTGIGLALCKRIIERHGGRIWVESTQGEGSAFHFTLPAGTPENVAAL
ncbi:MAG: PAS domain S-box protein [Magnetococcales bacterium]|nr:PAS domain S-box protein [Magnetococcales bacterium]